MRRVTASLSWLVSNEAFRCIGGNEKSRYSEAQHRSIRQGPLLSQRLNPKGDQSRPARGKTAAACWFQRGLDLKWCLSRNSRPGCFLDLESENAISRFLTNPTTYVVGFAGASLHRISFQMETKKVAIALRCRRSRHKKLEPPASACAAYANSTLCKAFYSYRGDVGDGKG